VKDVGQLLSQIRLGKAGKHNRRTYPDIQTDRDRFKKNRDICRKTKMKIQTGTKTDRDY
jgi:hypothetical protein